MEHDAPITYRVPTEPITTWTCQIGRHHMCLGTIYLMLPPSFGEPPCQCACHLKVAP